MTNLKNKVNHCWKCDGSGRLPEYAGIKDGVCFACGGVRTRNPEEIRALRIARKEADKARQEKERELYELPLALKEEKKAYEFFAKVVADDLHTMEEEEARIIGAMVKRKYKRIKEMEARLNELKSTLKK